MLNLLVMAQGEDKRLWVALTVSQQEQSIRQIKKAVTMQVQRAPPGGSRMCNVSPIHLALLDDHAVGLLSSDPPVEPQLCPVNHWKTGDTRGLVSCPHDAQFPECRWAASQSPSCWMEIPVLSEEEWSGLGLPRMFIRWLRFWKTNK